MRTRRLQNVPMGPPPGHRRAITLIELMVTIMRNLWRRNQTQAMRSRPGLTLIELLVVLAVIGLLVGLLLPAVQAAREASNRARCQNHLRQIGLALANYEATHRAYPFGVGGGGPPGYTPRWSAHSQLLPFLEREALFDSLNFSFVPWAHDQEYGPPNQTALGTRIGLFLCPSDWDNIEAPFGLAHNNYRANAGTLSHNVPVYNEPADATDSANRNTGVFWYQSAIRPAQIRDGSSSTAMFSERVLGDSVALNPRGDYYLMTGQPPNARTCARAVPGKTPRFTSFVEWSGQRWGDGNAFYSRYQHILPPNRPSCVFGQEDYDGPVIVTATSRHHNGVNLLMGDGSVRFAKESIAPELWKALGTIRGGEINNSSSSSFE